MLRASISNLAPLRAFSTTRLARLSNYVNRFSYFFLRDDSFLFYVIFTLLLFLFIYSFIFFWQKRSTTLNDTVSTTSIDYLEKRFSNFPLAYFLFLSLSLSPARTSRQRNDDYSIQMTYVGQCGSFFPVTSFFFNQFLNLPVARVFILSLHARTHARTHLLLFWYLCSYQRYLILPTHDL